MDYAQILVYILAATLALFLILAIVLIVLLIRITRQIKMITTTAERTVTGMEKFVSNARSATSVAGAAKIIAAQIKKMKQRRRQ